MRVLHLYSGNLYGGIEALLVTLAREGGEAVRHEFALCFPGRLRDELAAGGVPVPPWSPSRPWTPTGCGCWCIERTAARCRRGRP